MSADDRMKHLLTMLIQIIDTSNGSKHISDRLPYYDPIDNGFQLPFEQLLFDKRFNEYKIINEWKEIMNKHKKDNITLSAISTFIYKLTQTFLNSCNLRQGLPFYKQFFFF